MGKYGREMDDMGVYVDTFGIGHVTIYYDDGSTEEYTTEDYDEIYSIDPDEAERFEYLHRP